MVKKILVISPTPSHPQDAGNRVRIFNMLSFLVETGHEVYFLFSRQEKADEKIMKDFWGDRYFAVDYSKPALTPGQKAIRKIKLLLDSNHQYYTGVDQNYNSNLDNFIRGLLKEINFDIVIAEYIFQSKALLNFPEHVIKVIDTHDVMTDRHKLFLKEGKKPVWYSTSLKQERKGIRRADYIIAIQEHEKEFFSRLTPGEVINVGHLVRIEPISNTGPARKKLLFIGSKNPSNLHGINDFITDIFPALLESFPGLELIIAGNICEQVNDSPNIRKLGVVGDLKEAYDGSDIVINPLTIGTGLKIKMIEALGYSKAVISTDVGAEGLEEGRQKAYLIANSKEEYIEALTRLLGNKEVYHGICQEGRLLAEKWNERNSRELLNIFKL